jgi:hypothetical protein
MSTAALTQKAMALSLALLASCSATRHQVTGPTSPQELSRYALLIKSHADGQPTHEWVPLEDFDMATYQRAMSTAVPLPGIVRASTVDHGLNRYCEGRYDQCVTDCLRSPRPFQIDWRKYMDTQHKPWRTARTWWCGENCRSAEQDCKNRRGEWFADYQPSFYATDAAIDWIKQHREELLVGTVVVIAGVAFAVVGVIAGAIALAPLLVVAQAMPALPNEAQRAETRR